MAGSRHQARRRRVGDERVHRAVHEVPQIATLAQTTAIPVFPDCVIESDGTRPKFLLDAKYKGPVEKGILRIAEADIYGSLAFAKATGCGLIVLAYPALPDAAPLPPGSCSAFERVDLDGVRIVGIQIETRAISKSGALRSFATKIAQQLPASVAIKFRKPKHPEPPVALRVSQGGHHIPDEVVRRRLLAGRENFHRLYAPRVQAWALYDNAGDQPRLLAWSEKP